MEKIVVIGMGDEPELAKLIQLYPEIEIICISPEDLKKREMYTREKTPVMNLDELFIKIESSFRHLEDVNLIEESKIQSRNRK